MKKLLLLLLITSVSSLSFAAVSGTWSTRHADQADVQALPPGLQKMALNQFLELTPAKYQEMTGERLSIVQTVTLKAAQKYVKKQSKKSDDIPKGLYIVLAIFGWAWLAMGIMDNWEGSNWWINLLLTIFLCGIGGLIHALVKMKEYY